MIKRNLLTQVLRASKQFGVLSITGPRQSGKTTLSQLAFPNHQYVNLEDITQLQAIQDDPKAFIENVQDGVIIDEVQKFPDLLSYIQVSIDKKYQAGKFVITSSQNLLLSDKVNQSLAGRVAIITLLPLSLAELRAAKLKINKDYHQILLNGFYPGSYDKKVDRSLFYANYINTYVERDVRSISNIGNLSNFKRFLQILSGRIGQLLNLTSIANDIGVTHKTVDAWISILEASYIAFRLPPYYKNYGKRVIKSPKIYFYDVGLATYLLGINSKEELVNHFAIGALFENLIIADLFKTKYNQLSATNLFFWRDRSGHEIDLLLDGGTKQVIIEIKSSATYNSDYLKNLEVYKSISKTQHQSYLIYNGQIERQVKQNSLLNWQNLSKLNKHFK